ncbi:nucleoporin-domain-containing protein [Mucor ambiguus]|uniref:Nucleoporin-domain-containing protein n=1 Tax=Mucor ambiguus TaxID=91626 RepID=A0A0C9MGR8_9FUNG|nr:nucleoporin-domain-containing protein [Mucor ambiguus]
MPSNSTQETSMNAGKLIEQVINRDQDYPDLGTLLNGSPSESYIEPLLAPEEEFVRTNRVPIPKRFINRIVDQDQIIVRAELVEPKPDVFGDHIKYVLVISTPLQVILLAVSTTQAQSSTNLDTISLFATNMTMPADDEQMEQIGGTDDGRIFTIGKSGNVYEIEYHNPMKWLSRGCKLIKRSESSFMTYILPQLRHYMNSTPKARSFVIDNERKVLYILYKETDAIEVIYLGSPFNNYKKVCVLSAIKENAIKICRQQNRIHNSSDFDIETLHVISKAESKHIHLMAVTTTGYRLYFSHHKDSFRVIGSSSSYLPTEPNTLELGLVRLPPPTLTRQVGELAPTYFQTYYDCGISVSVIPKTEDSSTLRITSVTSAKATTTTTATLPSAQVVPTPSTLSMMAMPTKPTYAETDIALELDERVLVVTETNQYLAGRHYIKENSQQLASPPRQFMVLSTLSVLFFNKLRPVDILYKIFIKTREEPDTKLIQSFFERYGQVESCAMCLSIACASDERDIVMKANDTFFAYGGLPTSTLPTQIPGNHLGRAIGQTDVAYSGKHDGFVLYFARIIASVWKLKAFANHGNDMNAHLIYTQTQSTLSNTKENLCQLKMFMDRNPKFHNAASISDPRLQVADSNMVSLELAEQKSAHELYLMLVQCIEALSFIEFLFDSQVQNIIAEYLHNEHQTKIYDLDISAILTTAEGRELTRELVIAAITKYGSSYSQGGYDFVSKHLERFCSSFFGPNDISFFKGIEYLRRAMHDESDVERVKSLRNSLCSFKQAAAYISDAKLGSICLIYIQSSFHTGILDLVLERAKQIDPEDKGVAAFESVASLNENTDKLLRARLDAYKHIFNALEDVLVLEQRGVPEDRVPIARQYLSGYVSKVFDTAMASSDKLFHYQLYNWFLSHGLESKLLEYETPYLIPYFEKYIPDRVRSLGFMYQFYNQKHQYAEAFSCLYELAILPSQVLNLDKRIELLSQALINAKCGHLDANAEMKVNDLIQVASIQGRIKDILEGDTDNVEARQAVHDLDCRLYTQKELDESFVSRYSVVKDILSSQGF